MSLLREDIAIVGMAGIYPGAPNVEKFWTNILSKVDAVSDLPESWLAEDVFDPESTANDRIYCKKGGFIEEFAEFNPAEFGIMPSSIDGADPSHFLALRVAREALADAGYEDRSFNRQRTAVILGHTNCVPVSTVNIIQHGLVVSQILDILRRLHPEIAKTELEAIKQELKSNLPSLTADTVPGGMPNILTSRIANRMDLQGPNYTLDAACASSLISLDSGINELHNRRCDMAIVGGVHTSTNVALFIVFCLIGALSRHGRIRPFDKNADGTLLGEGVGMMIIKRRDDAERDGDRIYALVKGVGVASDGRAQGILTPRIEGQLLALERAYETSGISPETVGMIEAHGTATRVGDLTEIQALTGLLGRSDGDGALPSCALGTVKSMIGHPILAAGMAGLIKSALALYHKILPPTLCDEPNPELNFDKTPFYLNTETRPWIHHQQQPRRAGVSAFGFGGINAHVILEEYTGGENHGEAQFLPHHRDTELIILQAESRAALIETGKRLRDFISVSPEANLIDIAYTANCPLPDNSKYRLAIVASSVADLEKKLDHSLKRLADAQCDEIKDRSGIFFFEQPLSTEGKLAFLFSGEGAQYPNMLSDLCTHFPEVRASFDRADRVFAKNGRRPLLGQVLFPPPHALSELHTASEQAMWSMEYAVMAVYAADFALYTLLGRLDIVPHSLVGHSIGQDIALWASGALVADDEERFEERWLRYFLKTRVSDSAVEAQMPTVRLMAVGASDPSTIATIAAESNGQLFVSMDNCPNQVVLCGSDQAMEHAHDQLTKNGALCNFLPFDRPYHTPWYKPAREENIQDVRRTTIGPPQIEVYDCGTARPYPDDPDEIRKISVEQWVQPVRFRETIEAMYDAGVRIFVEVGPKGNLTSFVEDTLGRRRRYAAVPLNVSGMSAVTQLNQAVGLLASHGVPMRLSYLYDRRKVQQLPIFESGKTDIEKTPADVKASRKKQATIQLSMALPKLSLNKKIPIVSSEGKASIHTPQTATKEAPVRSVQDPPRSHVMEKYLATMERFLSDQQEIMGAVAGLKTGSRPKRSLTEQHLSRHPWPSAIARLPDSDGLRSCLCVETGDTVPPEALADLILDSEEVVSWQSLRRSQHQKKQWLRGRMAAKDAVYLFLKDRHQVEVRPKDILISPDEHGKPVVSGQQVEKLGCRLCLSIAHCDMTAVAVVGQKGKAWQEIGVDIERIDRNHEGLDEGGFTKGEIGLLTNILHPQRTQWLLRFWCAKEAVAKALGRGMMGSSFNLVISNVDFETGRINLTIAGQLAAELPGQTGRTFAAYTGCDEHLVFATSTI